MLNLCYLDNKKFLLDWNENFPLDHWWRKKYNIPFNSPKHRCVSHIDMYYDWLEEKMFEEYIENLQKETERQKIYKETGKWLHIDEVEVQEELIDKFDKLDISAFNFNVEDEQENLDDQL